MEKYCIIGDDKRSCYIRSMYINEGHEITSYKDADYIIAPIPFTRDGKFITGENIECDELINNLTGKVLFTGALKEEMVQKIGNNKYYDLMKIDDITILNSIPTAEGAIYEAIKNSDTTLNGANVLVMGYGNIGKILARMLDSFGARIFCEARNKKDIAFIKAMGYNSIELKNLDNYLPKMDYIFNTIPSLMLDERRLKTIKDEALIIDLASNPGGVDFEAASKLNKKVVWALSLPSKVAPKTAAKYLKEKIDEIIKNAT